MFYCCIFFFGSGLTMHVEEYLKGIKFCGYLISRLEKKNILQVFNFAIWWLPNISWVFNFTILVKIRNESLIEYQCNCYQICYRSSNFFTISRHMRYAGINIIFWSNVREKRISKSAGIYFCGVQNFAKMVKIRKNREIKYPGNLIPLS